MCVRACVRACVCECMRECGWACVCVCVRLHQQSLGRGGFGEVATASANNMDASRSLVSQGKHNLRDARHCRMTLALKRIMT